MWQVRVRGLTTVQIRGRDKKKMDETRVSLAREDELRGNDFLELQEQFRASLHVGVATSVRGVSFLAEFGASLFGIYIGLDAHLFQGDYFSRLLFRRGLRLCLAFCGRHNLPPVL